MLQFFCQDETRRAAVRESASLNGIDFLEVVDHESPVEELRQRTLLVWCLKPVSGLTKDNVQVEGGVRRLDIKVEWAHAATDVPAGLLRPEEVAFLAEIEDADHVLVVRTDAAGDFSTYTLRLVSDVGSSEPPANFDPVLSAMDFSFKVECPSDFDCAPVDACRPEPKTPPQLDYLAKDYASFRRLMLDRMAAIAPEWTERNAADVGVALVEVLAYTADRLSYAQDSASTEAYLGTARRRPSIRRHTRLLDYAMHDGVNARAWVTIEVDEAGDGATLPKGNAGSETRFLTRCVLPTVVTPEEWPTVLRENEPEVFEPMHALTLFRAHNRIRFHTWGNGDCCLPKGATAATLRDDPAARLRLAPGDVLVLEEVLGRDTGEPADADPTRRHVVRLTRVDPAAEASADDTGLPEAGPVKTDPLTGEAIVEVEWEEADALPFPLQISTVLDGTPVEDVAVARGNVLLADHGRTIHAARGDADEDLVPTTAPLDGRYRPRLGHGPVTQAVEETEAVLRSTPASLLIEQDPQATLPAVRILGEDGTWRPRRDLLASDRFAREFVVESERDGTARLRFGDGVLGRIPSPGAVFGVRYRVGNGTDGNVGAESLTHVVTDVLGITRVRNPLAAQGGVAPETMERARLDAPQAFRTQERAVTEEDYATMVKRDDRVENAVATMRWTGSWHTAFVAADRRGGKPVDEAFEADVERALDKYRLAGYDVELEPPVHVPLDVRMTVCVKPGHVRSTVRRALLDAFASYDLPDGRRGFFHPDNFTFGDAVYLSRIVATAMSVPGVQWVDAVERPGSANRFRRWGEDGHGESEAGVIRMQRLEIPRLDNDPNAPENGRIEFIMEGGS